MKFIINGQEVKDFTSRQERTISLPKLPSGIAGEVMPEAEARALAMRRIRLVWRIIGGFCGLIWSGLVVVILMDANATAPAVTLPFALAVLAFMIFMFRRSYAKSALVWRQRAPARMAALPPPGTAVALDAAGLTLGGEFFEWPQTSVACVEMASVSIKSRSILFIERIILDTAGRQIALDGSFMKNGGIIAAFAYQRLCRAGESGAPAGRA